MLAPVYENKLFSGYLEAHSRVCSHPCLYGLYGDLAAADKAIVVRRALLTSNVVKSLTTSRARREGKARLTKRSGAILRLFRADTNYQPPL
jgi:hypothetical protein